MPDSEPGRGSVALKIGNNSTLFHYDLAREGGENPTRIENTLVAAIEPFEAWKDGESRWKGEV